ncbi:MAG: hypothetical protein HQK96_12915 [Nitrospirae bacterium]|nr:hypothetical protein [Nitrospirota bacterium]
MQIIRPGSVLFTHYNGSILSEAIEQVEKLEVKSAFYPSHALICIDQGICVEAAEKGIAECSPAKYYYDPKETVIAKIPKGLNADSLFKIRTFAMAHLGDNYDYLGLLLGIPVERVLAWLKLMNSNEGLMLHQRNSFVCSAFVSACLQAAFPTSPFFKNRNIEQVDPAQLYQAFEWEAE